MNGLHIYDRGGVNYVYTGIDSGRKETADMINSLVSSMTDAPYTLAAFENNSWQDDLSPWKADGFGGKGGETLLRLKNEIIPAAEKTSPEKRFIAGYSLSGLFSLWAFYESGLWGGAASCSGSLWFPEWTDYAAARHAPDGSIVYLSLGDREERAKSRPFSEVGDRTRLMDKLLDEDACVRKHILEYNVGGHFSDTELRTAKGIAWLLNEKDR